MSFDPHNQPLELGTTFGPILEVRKLRLKDIE